MIHRPHFADGSVVVALVALAALSCGCGGTAAGDPSDPTDAVRADTRPTPEILEATGHRIFDTLVAAAPERLLVADDEMRRIVDPAAGERFAALRLGVATRIGSVSPLAFEGADYVGVCLQGARLEHAGGAHGLRSPAWIFERALVAGRMSSGRRVAAWVEGLFVQTERGFMALDLHSVEDPRWEHTDLEIAPCDMEAGIRHPQDVGMVTQ